MEDKEFLQNEIQKEIKQLRDALQAIINAPGGGPGRRIAMQALAASNSLNKKLVQNRNSK